jgi:hypothetical protein
MTALRRLELPLRVASRQITNWLNAAQELPMVVIC